jgi:demethylmenaquinone methyltransferase/2-methoxy-6-polyprenyl-1,4-benzoquinol methylase
MDKNNIEAMFNNIAKRYDFLNHFLSLGIDKYWRKKLAKLLKQQNISRSQILDIATGTGDLAITIHRYNKEAKITGIDISEQMLKYGRRKIAKKKLDDYINLQYGDSENINYADNTFDNVTVSFGIRNFENIEKGLSEMRRVLKHGGRAYILEFSMPQNFIIKKIYRLYFFKILPFLGRLFSGETNAYRYLPQSVDKFPDRYAMLEKLNKAGFDDAKYITLSWGIASIYIGKCG